MAKANFSDYSNKNMAKKDIVFYQDAAGQFKSALKPAPVIKGEKDKIDIRKNMFISIKVQEHSGDQDFNEMVAEPEDELHLQD